jgi:hypothetical protein
MLLATFTVTMVIDRITITSTSTTFLFIHSSLRHAVLLPFLVLLDVEIPATAFQRLEAVRPEL